MLFDNPIYETGEGGGGGGEGGGGKKKGAKGSPNKDATRAHEMETIAILRLKHLSIIFFTSRHSLSLSPSLIGHRWVIMSQWIMQRLAARHLDLGRRLQFLMNTSVCSSLSQ